MITVGIADLIIRINNKYDYTTELCRDYIVPPSTPDFTVDVTEADIDAEQTGDYDRGYLESLAVYRKIAEKISEYDGFLLHGCVIEAEGKGVAFLARSGTGKTTHTELWLRLLGDRCRIINGDKPIVRVINGKLIAYGTPYCGKEGFGCNDRVELEYVCFIERDRVNHTEICRDITERLANQIFVPKNNYKKTFEVVDFFIRRCLFYTVYCNMDISAAKTAYNTLFGGIEKRLATDGWYMGWTIGDSMRPFLRQGRDKVVVLARGNTELRKYDLPLYRRDNHFTMHRIVGTTSSGGYVISGDNRRGYEKDITDNDILGFCSYVMREDELIERQDKRFILFARCAVIRRALVRFPIRVYRRIFHNG